VAIWRNATGRSLSAATWLEAHHLAKQPERRRFARTLAVLNPSKIVDLGCGTGLWLDLLDQTLPAECEFAGIDSDPISIGEAEERARGWNRESSFVVADISATPERIPSGDLMLIFNFFSYLAEPRELLEYLYRERKAKRLVVRQYDGDLIRIGPMDQADRRMIDDSLRSSLMTSREFRHYDLDETYDCLMRSPFNVDRLEFEVTERHSPFPEEFLAYFEGTISWMRDHLSEAAKEALGRFERERIEGDQPIYVVQEDLVALLSAPVT
jgi:SAM-dependent methyltransferase